MNKSLINIFLLFPLVLLNPLTAAMDASAIEGYTEKRRKAFKEVVDFVLDFSHGSREVDEEALKAVQKKPRSYKRYGSKIVHVLRNLTELENKRPLLLRVSDQKAHWIFDPKEFLRKKAELGLQATEVTWDYRVSFRRVQLNSGMSYMQFLDYLKATLMYETLYTQQKVKAKWGDNFKGGAIFTNMLPLWYQSEGWLKEYQQTLWIP